MNAIQIEKQIESELGIDEKNINEIFKCIVKGSTEDVRAKRNLFPSPTYNARYNDIWDSINAKCAATFNDGYIVTMHHRGIYEFITILNTSSSCVYILMKDNNFNKVISGGSVSDTHYMKCLTLINNDLKSYPQVYGQISFDLPQSDKLKDKKDSIKGTIIQKINGSANRFVVITFEPDINTGIKSIYVNVVADNTSTKYRKDWTSSIKAIEVPEYDESTYDKRNLDTDVDNVSTFDAPAEVKIKRRIQDVRSKK
ncbi:DUF5986 family protein [Clostridium magnum]|uniref:Uncharacterized protein n=1 Tax=Clostridium magnum DSM 2767 TaxID=1121326 RepID=A0A161X050_9CLOT|nr:DUF5986 family protein [Clostridium magnum]KZL92808.1 hypothetical protein CLMAG_26220 [Clostridium magnum DSM 2767]SHI28606.1 hypothetical protein SAMN02745944_04022 [Clostridium magnum DSM 2767]